MSSETSSLPIDTAAFMEHCETMGAYSASALEAAVRSHRLLGSATTPLGHLMMLKEHDHLQRLGDVFADGHVAMQAKDRPSTRGIDLGLWRSALRYRLGAWVGTTHVQLTNPVDLQVNPDRRYLLPEVMTSQTICEYVARCTYEAPPDFYVRLAARQRCIQSDMTPDSAVSVLRGKGFRPLLRPLKGEEPDSVAGAVWHGIYDAFRLHQLLLDEEHVAPHTPQIFHPDLHIPINSHPEMSHPPELGKRFRVSGFKPEGGPQVWGEVPVPDHKITEAYRGIGSWVMAAGGMMGVVFRQSEQSYAGFSQDALNVTIGDQELPLHWAPPASTCTRMLSSLSQGSGTIFLGEPPHALPKDLGLISPMTLDEHRQILARVA